MKREISATALSICRASVKIRLDSVNDSIRLFEEEKREVPSTLIDRRRDFIDVINELENALYS